MSRRRRNHAWHWIRAGDGPRDMKTQHEPNEIHNGFHPCRNYPIAFEALEPPSTRRRCRFTMGAPPAYVTPERALEKAPSCRTTDRAAAGQRGLGPRPEAVRGAIRNNGAATGTTPRSLADDGAGPARAGAAPHGAVLKAIEAASARSTTSRSSGPRGRRGASGPGGCGGCAAAPSSRSRARPTRTPRSWTAPAPRNVLLASTCGSTPTTSSTEPAPRLRERVVSTS